MLGIALVLILGAGAYWLWFCTMQLRERAVRASRAACRDAGVQLLDQTVALRQWRLRRDARGRVQLQRLYLFEYSEDGLDRHVGRVIFRGKRLDYVCFEHHDRPMTLHCDKVLDCGPAVEGAVDRSP